MNKFFCVECQKWHWGKSIKGMCLKCYSDSLRHSSIQVISIEEFRNRMFRPPLGNEEGGYSTYDL